MVLKASGTIYMSEINVERGLAATTPITLNDSANRTLAGVASGPIGLGHFYNKTFADTAFSIAKINSSVTYSSSKSFPGSNMSEMMGVFFKPDGTGAYVVFQWMKKVFYVPFSTAWNVNNVKISNGSTNFSIPECPDPLGITFNTTGTSMYVGTYVSSTQVDVKQYNLSVAWDITKAVYSSTFSFSSNISNSGYGPFITFTPNGNKLLIGNYNGITEFPLATSWAISTATNTGTTLTWGAASGYTYYCQGIRWISSTSFETYATTGGSTIYRNTYSTTTSYSIAGATFSSTDTQTTQTPRGGILFNGSSMIIGGWDYFYSYSGSWAAPTLTSTSSAIGEGWNFAAQSNVYGFVYDSTATYGLQLRTNTGVSGQWAITQIKNNTSGVGPAFEIMGGLVFSGTKVSFAFKENVALYVLADSTLYTYSFNSSQLINQWTLVSTLNLSSLGGVSPMLIENDYNSSTALTLLDNSVLCGISIQAGSGVPISIWPRLDANGNTKTIANAPSFRAMRYAPNRNDLIFKDSSTYRLYTSPDYASVGNNTIASSLAASTSSSGSLYGVANNSIGIATYDQTTFKNINESTVTCPVNQSNSPCASAQFIYYLSSTGSAAPYNIYINKFNPTTLVTESSALLRTQSTATVGTIGTIDVSMDGLHLYVCDGTALTIYHYTMSTANDLTTLSSVQNTFSTAALPMSIFISSDGNYIFYRTGSVSASTLYKVTLTTPYNLNSGVASGSNAIYNIGSNTPQFCITNDGLRFIMFANNVPSAADDIFEWELGSAYNIIGLSAVPTRSINKYNDKPRGSVFLKTFKCLITNASNSGYKTTF